MRRTVPRAVWPWFVLCMAIWAACDDGAAPDPSSTGGGGSASTTTTTASTTGVGGLGGGGGGPFDCAALLDQLVAFAEAHQSCDESNPCVRLDPPLFPDNDPLLCSLDAALGDDGAALAALVDSWNESDCGPVSIDGDFVCGAAPGQATCEAGKCVRKDPLAECDTCDTTLDPVCTVGNQNALNACFAEKCLLEAVAYPGYCEDSATCDAAGGDCEATFLDEPFCPLGSKYDLADMAQGCAQGNLVGTCCTPWAEPCAFVAFSYNLSLDPFTCADPPTSPPWTCLYIAEQTSCSASATLAHALEDIPADVSVEVGPGHQVVVNGTHGETGRTFVCTGEMGYGMTDADGAIWSCTACDAGGTSCTTCDVVEHRYCDL